MHIIIFETAWLSMLQTNQCWGGVLMMQWLKVMDYRIVVSEFILQSRYYIHFLANTLGNGMNPFILLTMG